MKINFVLPFINWTGGIRVAFEYAEGLHRRGNDVAVYFPLVPYRFSDRLCTARGLHRWVGDLFLNLRRRAKQERRALSVPLLMVPRVADIFLRKADAVVATAWPTAYSVSRLSSSRGSKFHLVQHHETWSGPPEVVERCYRLPLQKIVIASWLKSLVQELSGQPVLDTITNGVDFSLFYPENASVTTRSRVLMQYSPLPWKGMADGLNAWDTIKRECPGVQLVMFGMEPGQDVPPDSEFHADPPQPSLRALYSSCDVFLSTSWVEGCQLPPMEAMACGCAVVATNVGGVPDYSIASKTALVIDPHDINGMAAAVIKLLRDADERRRIARAGFEYIQQFTWERAVEKFEAALLRGMGS